MRFDANDTLTSIMELGWACERTVRAAAGIQQLVPSSQKGNVRPVNLVLPTAESMHGAAREAQISSPLEAYFDIS